MASSDRILGRATGVKAHLHDFRQDFEWATSNLENALATPPSQRAEDMRIVFRQNSSDGRKLRIAIELLCNGDTAEAWRRLVDLSMERIQERFKLNRKPGYDGDELTGFTAKKAGW